MQSDNAEKLIELRLLQRWQLRESVLQKMDFYQTGHRWSILNGNISNKVNTPNPKILTRQRSVNSYSPRRATRNVKNPFRMCMM
ncbi:hypothetical protein J6590_033503 [Homalodisca vitripennis]|nr:hypothetical protein J6590_033503 [Homalodisca vitripennis]